MDRTAKIELRVTPEEKATIVARAEDAGLSTSDWLRSRGADVGGGAATSVATPADVSAVDWAAYDRAVLKAHRKTGSTSRALREARLELGLS